jgi:hypothetical protein
MWNRMIMPVLCDTPERLAHALNVGLLQRVLCLRALLSRCCVLLQEV